MFDILALYDRITGTYSTELVLVPSHTNLVKGTEARHAVYAQYHGAMLMLTAFLYPGSIP